MLWLPGDGNYRVAVVVSKKVHKSAVVRNRIRRRLYEITRTTFAGGDHHCDVVFVIQSPLLADLPASDVLAEVTTLLKKIA